METILSDLKRRGFSYTEDYNFLRVSAPCEEGWETPPDTQEIEECKSAIIRAINLHGSLEKAVLMQNYDVFIEEYQGEVSDHTLATFLACQELILPVWYKPLTFSERDVYGTALDTTSIYETTNYSIFDIPAEKKISRAKLDRIKRLIETENLLRDRCIIVHYYDVLDGVHRLLAAKELALPIYFKCSQTSQLANERVSRLEALDKRLEQLESVMP